MNDDSTPDTGGNDDENDRDYSHLENNDHAEGNPGGGAPPDNLNAMKHGLHVSDPDNLLSWLSEHDPAAVEWVEHKYNDYLARADFGHDSALADQLKQVVVREYSIWAASGLQVREGVVKRQAVETGSGEWITAEKENAANIALDRMERTVMRRLKELGVLKESPDAKLAEAMTMESEDYIITIGEDDLDEDDDEEEWTIERPLEDDSDE